MTTITVDQADEIAEHLDATVAPDYSGRGMCGDTCLGFTGSFDPTRLGVVLAHVLGMDQAFDLTEQARRDDMGLGIIMYFPGVTLDEGQAP